MDLVPEIQTQACHKQTYQI